MSYRISKRFRFAASHMLTGLPEGHKCIRLHGHNYEVEVELSDDPGPFGMIMDYGELAAIVDPVIDKYDHRHLNDLMPQPTAERIAQRIFHDVWKAMGDQYAILSAVRVYETPTTMAEFSAT